MTKEEVMNRKYPHFNRIENLKPNPHIMLGHDIYWTLKVDGSNTGFYFGEDGEIKIRSRNMDVAMFFEKVLDLEVSKRIMDMMRFYLEMYGVHYVVFGELLSRGRSPTGLKVFDKDDLIIFDIYDIEAGKWVHFDKMCLMCGPFGIPVVPLMGKCNVNTLEELYSYRDEMLDATKGEEGVVAKIYKNPHETIRDNYLFVKEKHFIQNVKKVRSKDGKIKLPQLEEGEVRKCLFKVMDEIGMVQFKDPKLAMPKIANEVNLECKQQNCSNKINLFHLYRTVLEEFLKNDIIKITEEVL